MISLLLFLVVVGLLGVIAWAVSKTIGWVFSGGLFVLGFLIVAYLIMPGPIEPYLGWVRDLVSGIVDFFRETWYYVTSVLR